MKQMLVEYTAAYMQGGTAEMATYVDKDGCRRGGRCPGWRGGQQGARRALG
jgi:hypothetical protein